MKVEINKIELKELLSEKEQVYPILGIWDTNILLIVLFYNEKIGTVIYSETDAFSIGEFAKNWKMDEFVLCGYEIIIKNS